MRPGSAVEGVILVRVFRALGSVNPLYAGLRRFHMPRSGLQDLRSVVEQRELVDMFTRADTPQEGVSLCQDGLDG